jgi:hypothetical protein
MAVRGCHQDGWPWRRAAAEDDVPDVPDGLVQFADGMVDPGCSPSLSAEMPVGCADVLAGPRALGDDVNQAADVSNVAGGNR